MASLRGFFVPHGFPSRLKKQLVKSYMGNTKSYLENNLKSIFHCRKFLSSLPTLTEFYVHIIFILTFGGSFKVKDNLFLPTSKATDIYPRNNSCICKSAVRSPTAVSHRPGFNIGTQSNMCMYLSTCMCERQFSTQQIHMLVNSSSLVLTQMPLI